MTTIVLHQHQRPPSPLHQCQSLPNPLQGLHHPPRQHHPPTPDHRHPLQQPDHRHPLQQPEHRQHHLLRLVFLPDLSSILTILMQGFSNPSDQKSPCPSQQFLIKTPPSLKPTFTPFPKPSAMPTSYLHPTRKSVPFWKLTQEAEWNQVLTM